MILTQYTTKPQTERMGGNALSKYENEDSNQSEEDVNEYKQDYNEIADAFYHCAHCEYRTNYRCELKEHMEIEHIRNENAPSAESESLIEEEDLMDAIEVWKIYKLLQRMKNK